MRYKVVERRYVDVEYEIEADNEFDAGRLRGDITSENEIDSYGGELLSVELIDTKGSIDYHE